MIGSHGTLSDEERGAASGAFYLYFCSQEYCVCVFATSHPDKPHALLLP